MVVRLWGIGFGLPYLYHPDEPAYVSIALSILHTGDPNPHFFNYPSLFLYINTLAYLPLLVWGLIAGIYTGPTGLLLPEQLALGVARAPLPDVFIIGRATTALFSVLTVILVWRIASRMYGRRVGVLAAIFLALSPTAVQHAHYITPDTFVTFFAVAATLFALRVLQTRQTRNYLLAGALAGFAAGSKYNGIIALTPLITAHLLRVEWSARRWDTWRFLLDRRFLLALGMAPLAFVASTPYAIITPRAFFSDLLFEASHYAGGHPGMEGGTVVWYLRYLWSWEGVIFTLAVVQLVRIVAQRERSDLVVASFPVVYFLMITNYTVRNERTALLLIPYLCLLAAGGLVSVVRWTTRFRWGSTIRTVGIVLLAIFVLALPVRRVLAVNQELAGPDARGLAQAWVDTNLPPNSKVAAESYAPFLAPDRYDVVYQPRLIDHTAGWYVENGFEYLIFSQWMYGRFYEEPERYAQEVAGYNALFARFQKVAHFEAVAIAVQVFRNAEVNP